MTAKNSKQMVIVYLPIFSSTNDDNKLNLMRFTANVLPLYYERTRTVNLKTSNVERNTTTTGNF